MLRDYQIEICEKVNEAFEAHRSVKTPVGRYCAMESYPGIWGVIAVDGKVEVEPRYEDVVIHTDGTVDLTVRPGKVITKKLP